jgi:hypothetical protein
MRRQFVVSMVAGMLGAMLVVSGPAAVAAIGDAIRIGQVNAGNARTTVRGDTDGALVKMVNTGGGDTALQLVSEGPNLNVSNKKRIKRLNADRVDGFHANQLIRAAHAQSADLADADGAALTVEIVAPANGILIMGAAVDAQGDFDAYNCFLAVDGNPIVGSVMHSTLHFAGTVHTVNSDENCSTTGGAVVDKGTHEVALMIGDLDLGALLNGSLWAMFVPFDGTGAKLVP